ncbi:hypothetical protein L6164_035402 [Bauhinia variegata]|uniref:Uncharacterized protein n=1 Tax=Bauhinia variegata TaxID=167791 RepID=A0ACB9KDV7_BAUVA|nr:hypothetical protein L6164_035402 [Bauhinia variegata]
MAFEKWLWFMLVLLLLAATRMQQYCVHGQQQVPCLFVFGDSLSDSGNNKKLATFAKANYPPYAIDSSIGPTGRFTNGRNAIDYITQFLGFANLIPPFASSSGFDILKGVNYASGSAGIHNETGTHLALHNEFGGRKFALNGLGLIGCIPFEISNNGISGLCVAYQNFAVAFFNNNLRSLVGQLNEDLSDTQFIYVDNVAIPAQYPLSGFLEFNIACCPVRGDGQCIPNETPCQNRNQYVFYDGFHTTEPVNLITAISSYNASNPFYTYPMDINHLVNSG